ncbi:TylF/MycF/NovP-related O-methyltransferase [Saccharomonospora azurea]|uniref:TylF/MycF/NovP-related O-methyltransferase n=1 Tax=Saccharomonospora azurea TaxID=40988 RepID=UPI003D8EA34F
MTEHDTGCPVGTDPVRLYMALLRKCLTRTSDGEIFLGEPHRRHKDPADLRVGREFHHQAETMIGERRLDHVGELALDAISRGVAGDFAEAGVWRGGTCVYLRGVLAAIGEHDRRVWVADSFDGLPPPNPDEYPADEGDTHHLATEMIVGEEHVRSVFERFGLLDDQVRFLPGLFRDTLPTAPIEQLALLRIDADMYESTAQALEHLYPKLSPGGYCVVDDYGALRRCRAAVDDFRARHRIEQPLERIDWTGVWWRREH